MQFMMTTVWRGLTGTDTWMKLFPAKALKENVGITQTGGAAAVLIAVPVSMEGLLCLLPDLLRHVCLENTSQLSHGTSELHRQDDV